MTDDSIIRANPDHTQATTSKPSTTTPSASSPIGDPVRRGLGDKTDDESQRTDRSKGNHSRFEDESEDDGGEGHKVPRADAGSSPDSRSQGAHSSSTGQPPKPGQQSQKSSQPSTKDSSGGECCGSDMDSKAGGSTKK
jgi:hypothetical protein